MTETTKVKERGHRGRLFVSIGVLFAVGLAAYGILSRDDTVVALKRDAEDTALPRVQVVSPRQGPSQRALTLPGNIEAWYQAPIYAQVTGYVAHWYKDYGARVKAGDVLATIDTPSLDAQFAASKAMLNVAQTHYQLAAITAKRWVGLSGTQAVSQEDVDIKKADAAAQKAQVAAAQQDVDRYAAMIAFKTLVAPFDGVVTVRSTNIGDYVNATGANDALRGMATALFQVADIHQMRIFVSVPQGYGDVLKPGLTATLTLPQDPSNPIPVQFLTTANAVTQSTRTVVTEFTVDNTNGKLWPGTYANVHLTFPSDPNILILPEQALMFRAQGMQVAVLDSENRVHLQNVTLGHNLDTEVQIISGLKATDRVVASPSAGLLEGQQVKVVQPVAGYRSGPGGQGSASKKPVTASTPAPAGSTADAGPLSTPPTGEKEASEALTSPIPSSVEAEPAGQPKPGAGTSQ